MVEEGAGRPANIALRRLCPAKFNGRDARMSMRASRLLAMKPSALFNTHIITRIHTPLIIFIGPLPEVGSFARFVKLAEYLQLRGYKVGK